MLSRHFYQLSLPLFGVTQPAIQVLRLQCLEDVLCPDSIPEVNLDIYSISVPAVAGFVAMTGNTVAQIFLATTLVALYPSNSANYV